MKKNNIPNLLTILRMILVIPFLILMALVINMKITNDDTVISYSSLMANSNGGLFFMISGIIFIIAMITDFIDGKIARSNNLVTTFGKVFDPIADKVMTTSALIMLTILNIVPFWIIIIFVTRDIIVDGMRNLAATKNKDIAASIWGKIKTLVQSFAIVLIFIIYPAFEFKFLNNVWGFSNWKLLLLCTPLFFSAILSIFSGYKYVINLREFIKLS